MVAAALSQIFPSSYSSSIFVILTPSSGVSWKVTLSDRIYIRSALGLFEEIFLLRTPFPTFSLESYLGDFELNTLTIAYSFSDQSMPSAKAQVPIYNFGPLSLHIVWFSSMYKLKFLTTHLVILLIQGSI